MNARSWLFAGSLCGLIGVAAGAFGAHALKDHLTPGALATFDVGVRYQLVHAVALLVVGLVSHMMPGRVAKGPLRLAGYAFTVGVVLFSGSLYAMTLSGWRALGAITPLGGVSFLLGWLALGWGSIRAGNDAKDDPAV